MQAENGAAATHILGWIPRRVRPGHLRISLLWRQTLSNRTRAIRRSERRRIDHTLCMKILRQTNVLMACQGAFACEKACLAVRARALPPSLAPCPRQSGVRSFVHPSRIIRASLFTHHGPSYSSSVAFSVLMGVPKRAYSGVFIGENAHRSRGIGCTWAETAFASWPCGVFREKRFVEPTRRSLDINPRRCGW